jgi:hypothetical protein
MAMIKVRLAIITLSIVRMKIWLVLSSTRYRLDPRLDEIITNGNVLISYFLS